MISLLLSTYNGSQFIPSLFDSLSEQTIKEWRLIVRDDLSSDDTVTIIESYKSKLQQDVLILKGQNRIGPAKSFLKLISNFKDCYYFLVDQDDIWLPYKIEKMINKMNHLEVKYGKDTPILIHSDLMVVDKNMNIIHDSLWEYQGLNPKLKCLNSCLVQNNITGCTVMINFSLKKYISYIPKKVIMHDWWLGLLAATFGVIDYIEEPLVLYRQHENQDTGARKYSIGYFFNAFIRNPRFAYRSIIRTYEQAVEFYEIYKDIMPYDKKQTIIEYINLFSSGRFRRLWSIYNNKFFKQGFIRNLGYLAVMFSMAKNEKYKHINSVV